MGEPSPPAKLDSAAWRAAVGDATGVRFSEITRPDLTLEGSVFAHPIVGSETVLGALRLSGSLYDDLRFVHDTVTPERAVFEWEADALGLQLAGVTVLTRDPDGRVTHVGPHHRPLGAVLRFSAELGDRLTTSINGRQRP